MADNVKELQQLAEAAGGASTLEWSTISHTHGGAAAVNAQNVAIDIKDGINFVRQLQQLPQPAGAQPLDWSTISHTHT
ncbi:hypothetical protein ACQR0V_12185 [Bradyrhizobium sp. HKCCYLS2058]|uniref:hypothetical protein n=1 Tax=unclassified Bradyrhizobium TaxID=2631580 RepID=UPI003EB737CD